MMEYDSKMYYQKQQMMRMERNEKRTNIRVPHKLLIQIKLRACEQWVKPNTYVINLFKLALKNINVVDEPIENYYSPNDYDDLKPFQIVLPLSLLTEIKIFGILLDERKYYKDKPNGLTTKGRSIIDLLYSALILEERNAKQQNN